MSYNNEISPQINRQLHVNQNWKFVEHDAVKINPRKKSDITSNNNNQYDKTLKCCKKYVDIEISKLITKIECERDCGYSNCNNYCCIKSREGESWGERGESCGDRGESWGDRGESWGERGESWTNLGISG